MDADHHHFSEEPGKSGSQQQSQAQSNSLKKKGAFQITSVRDHKPEENLDETDLQRTELSSEATPRRTPSGDVSAASSSAHANGDLANYSELSLDHHMVSGFPHADAESAHEVEANSLSPQSVSNFSSAATAPLTIAPSSTVTANLITSNVVEESEVERNLGEAQTSSNSRQSRFRVVKVGSNPPVTVAMQAATMSNPHLPIAGQPLANVVNKKMSVPVGPSQNAYQIGRWNVVDTNEGDMQHGSTMPHSHVGERDGTVQQQPSQVTSPTSFPQTSIGSSVPVFNAVTSTTAAPPVSVVPPVSAAKTVLPNLPPPQQQAYVQPQPNLTSLPPATVMTPPQTAAAQQYTNPMQFAQQQLAVGSLGNANGIGNVKYTTQPKPTPAPAPMQAQVQGANTLLSGQVSAMQSATMSVPVQPVQPMLAGNASQPGPQLQQPLLQPQVQTPSGLAKPLQNQPVNVPQTLLQNTQPPPHPNTLQNNLQPSQPQFVSTPQQPTANQFVNVAQYSAPPAYLNASQVQPQAPSQRPPAATTQSQQPPSQPQPQPLLQLQAQPPAANPINVNLTNTLSTAPSASSFETRIDKAFEEFKRELMKMVNDELVELHNEISDLRETRYQLDHENVVLRRHATQETLKMVDQIRREHNALLHAAPSAGSLSTSTSTSTGYVNAPSGLHNLHIG